MGRTSSNPLKFSTFALFPLIGNTQDLYIATDTNLLYRWTGSAYVLVGDGGGAETLAQTLALGNSTGANDIIVTTGQKIKGQTSLMLTDSGLNNYYFAGPNYLFQQWYNGIKTDFILQGGGTQIYSDDSIDIQTANGLYNFFSGGTYNGVFNFASIASSHKTFTFPNTSGTVALTSDLTGMVTGTGTANRLAYWSSTSTIASDAFYVNTTNDAIGIQVDPLTPLHVTSVAGTTLNDVVSGSASLVNESLPSAPSGSTVLIAEPAATGSGNVSFIDQGAGSYTGNGDTYTYRIYTCISGGGANYQSQYYLDISNTIPNDADTYNISVDWADVVVSGETVTYYVEKDVNSGGFSAFGVYATSNLTDSGGGAGGSTTAYPNFYQNIPASPPTAYTGGTATAQDVGSGAFSEVPNTILMEVDSVLTINGTDYVSGSPTGGSFDDTGLTSYNPEISWTDNGNSTNSIARVSQDSGSTWIYKYTGSSSSPFKFTDQSNDSSAQARWGQTYSAGAIQYNFAPYSTGSSPSSNTIYSTVGSTYGASIPADSVKYLVKHVLTGGTTPWKVLAPQSSPAYGVTFSSDYYDTGYTSWGAGTTVTPSSYGFTGTNQNRGYKIYSSGSGIFAVNPLTVTTTASGGTKSVSLSWSLPSGISIVRILRSINGGSYNFYKDVAGTSTTDDTTDLGWGSGSTVTPNSIIPGTARFDRAGNNSTTATPTLQVVDTTGSGQRYATIGFGVAANSASAATFQSYISHDSNTGYLTLVNRVQVASSLGGTVTNVLGGDNELNKNKSSTGFTKIWSSTTTQPAIMVDNSSGAVSVYGGTTSSVQGFTVRQRTGGTVGLALQAFNSSPGNDLMQVLSDVGSIMSGINPTGRWRASAGASAADPGLMFQGNTTSGFWSITTNTIGIAAGGVEQARWTTAGFSIKTTSTPTAKLMIGAQTTAANSAPIKLIAGTLMTSPEAGAIEMATDKLYWTQNTSSTRLRFGLSNGDLTAARVVYVGTGGILLDNANFTYSINRLSPTYITLAAGTATAGTAPLVFTTGTSLTAAIAGAVEYTTDDLFFTISTGTARKRFLFADPVGGLTSGRVPIVTTNGRLTDDADMTFATDTLTVTKVKANSVGGYISSDGSTGATGTFTSADAKTITVKDGIITSIV